MSIPTNEDILALLDRLDLEKADGLESQWLDFKPWDGPKQSRKVAVECTVCFANGDGGVAVFGVKDKVTGRARAIHGVKDCDTNAWRRDIYDSTRPCITVAVEELSVPEGTGKLLIVRVPRGEPGTVYGTTEGVFKKRVGKSCMPLDPQAFLRQRVSTGAVDWSGEPAAGTSVADLEPVEIARARKMLRRVVPGSDLLALEDSAFLQALGAVRGETVTHAGLILFGREEILANRCPQHQVHYVHQLYDTEVARNDSYRAGLLNILEHVEQAFSSPVNPEREVTVGLLKLRIPAFPIDVVREAVLNAVTHRDYADPGEVLIRHTREELIITSPGAFLADITPNNILRHEPLARNQNLAEIFQKLRLVERAGIGRKRIFVPMLSHGKRIPEYVADERRVTLRLFDGKFDERMAALVAKLNDQGRVADLDGLLLLSFLRENQFIDTSTACSLLQLPRDSARAILDQYAQPRQGILERRGRTKAATYHLTKGVAKELLGKAAYTKTRGLDPIRYAEMVRTFVSDHGSITPQECRELLGLGESPSAKVEVSRYFKQWSDGDKAFLLKRGKGPSTRYYLLDSPGTTNVSTEPVG